MIRTLALPLLLAVLAPALPAHADPGDAQGEVRKERKAGKVLSLRAIENRVLPTKRGMQYLGPEYDPAAMVYRLKFLDKVQVIFVDVDARSGEIIRETR
ncbi:MAG: PepSY domain-containing protein [Novosphingobium sp.]